MAQTSASSTTKQPKRTVTHWLPTPASYGPPSTSKTPSTPRPLAREPMSPTRPSDTSAQPASPTSTPTAPTPSTSPPSSTATPADPYDHPVSRSTSQRNLTDDQTTRSLAPRRTSLPGSNVRPPTDTSRVRKPTSRSSATTQSRTGSRQPWETSTCCVHRPATPKCSMSICRLRHFNVGAGAPVDVSLLVRPGGARVLESRGVEAAATTRSMELRGSFLVSVGIRIRDDAVDGAHRQREVDDGAASRSMCRQQLDSGDDGADLKRNHRVDRHPDVVCNHFAQG